MNFPISLFLFSNYTPHGNSAVFFFFILCHDFNNVRRAKKDYSCPLWLFKNTLPIQFVNCTNDKVCLNLIKKYSKK